MQDIAERLLRKHSRQQIKQLISLLLPEAPTGFITAKEFAFVQEAMTRRRNGYSDTSIAIARLHLVEGASISEAAKEKNVTYQCAYAVIRRVKMTILEKKAINHS